MKGRQRTIRAQALFVAEQKLVSGEIVSAYWEIFPLGQYHGSDREVLETWDEDLSRALAKFEKNVFDLYGSDVEVMVRTYKSGKNQEGKPERSGG